MQALADECGSYNLLQGFVNDETQPLLWRWWPVRGLVAPDPQCGPTRVVALMKVYEMHMRLRCHPSAGFPRSGTFGGAESKLLVYLNQPLKGHLYETR